ncbi:Zn-dependent exopeptidase [Glarea lozoyensis ATCC 20868]|uniref:Zn-dependent exopeptidase n=1 Tax=Glarea lozoyensis (strain ATCC 20868 / MF5171) TaxID=1116229 RepID=S3CMR3_GLAL2|nr:Zn-dependent exopeptidase [Glarea lozoyensis ATCC 20868]EPE26499.1 Zn-dependent exopeptidase [Glarea lozoyensis ATCC 20868]
MLYSLISLGLTLTAVTGVLAKTSYDGAQAVRVAVGDDVVPLMKIIDKLSLASWKGVGPNGVPRANGNVDLVVPAKKVAEFTALVDGMEFEVMHEDLGASISAEEEESVSFKSSAAAAVDVTYFNAYHAYADHLTFLRDLQAQYPTRSEIVTAGNSNGGRPITGIHFYGTAAGKPAVVLHGNVHAREWITGMTTEYLAWYLLTNYASSSEVKSFVDKYDFYIFPIVNPDGFVYTQTNDRLWRKNRQTTPNSSCIGRDVNRNWPFQWAVTGGASTDPCNETFKGRAAGDATENVGLRNYISTLAAKQKVQLFIDIHSYSQLFMTPYGYSCSALATNNAALQSLARGTASAIQAVYGTVYEYGPICSTIYQATGSSVDWVNDIAKAKYTFTIELRDTGRYGFILPPAQILPTALETYQGFRYLLLNMVL